MALKPLNGSNPTPSETFGRPVGSVHGVSADYVHGVLVGSAHGVRARLELSLRVNPRFSCPLYVGKNRLAKVPAQKLIDRPKWIAEEPLIEMTTGDVVRAGSR